MAPPPRYNVLGVHIHALELESARAQIIAAAQARPDGRPGKNYVCFCDAHSLGQARRDPRHRAILNNAFIAAPDGMPIVWAGRLQGHRTVSRVYGPDLLLAICAATAGTRLTHFFYGAGPGTAELLAEKMLGRFPGLRICGTHTPPFGEISTARSEALLAEIDRLRPDFFWVGLSTPRQEKFMADFAPRLQAGVLLGVGAAFDFHSGRIRQAPRWMQRSGTEWLFRLAMEPSRLGSRYLRNHPLFALRLLAQLCGLRRYDP